MSHDHHDHDHAAHSSAKHDHGHSDHEHSDHGHGEHGHSHDVRDVPSERLRAALVLTVGFLVVEAVGGYLTHSLALLSDAGHMLADSGALAIALAARVVGRRPRSALRTFGYRRAEVIAALVNALVLFGGAIAIVLEAIERWRTPRPVHGLPMLVIAVIGLLVNLCSAWILSRGREGHDTNTRAALAHVMSDALGSVGAITAAILVITLRWTRADAVISLGIAALVALASVQLLRQAGHVLMEGVPHGLSMEEVAKTVRGTDGVHSMHDLHAWRIADGFDAAMVHIVVSDEHEALLVAERVATRIREVHKIAHVTVQPERRDSECRDCEPNRTL